MINYNIKELSLDEKIGQLIVFGFDALSLNDHAINLITKYKVGNVILFARNIKSPKQLFTLNKNLQELAMKTTGIPLIISIDQEGGMVTRIKNGGTFFPGAMTLSASDNIENSYLAGKHMGRELSALGINMNLAPVLDVNNNPHNPVIGVRSYSDDKHRVSEYGSEFIKGLQESVIATAKHFPGHGDTKVDSHLALPKIDKSFESLMDIEIVPFKHAIDNGLQAIMSAHINFPSITDHGYPTTLSRKCLTGLLRDKLGFEGLIITDCMQMKAIQKNYTTPVGALLAIEAGANLVCISHSEELQTKSVEYIKFTIENSDLSEKLIDERVRKVLEYKSKHVLFDSRKTYENVQSIIEDKKTKEFSYNVCKEAVTLIKGDIITQNVKTLVIASNPLSTTIADEDDGSVSIVQAIKESSLNFDTLEVSMKLDEKLDEILKTASLYEQVIFCSYNANIYQNQLKLIKKLNHAVELKVIMMRNPYDSVFVKEIKHLVAMYEYTPNSVNVLLEYLNGDFTPSGKLVVTL
jgi:beta-N-acetylhexosaminidase